MRSRRETQRVVADFDGDAAPSPRSGENAARAPRLHRIARISTLLVFGVILRAATPVPPHQFLTELCDDFGARLTGSPANAAALDRLADALRALGLKPEKVPF